MMIKKLKILLFGLVLVLTQFAIFAQSEAPSTTDLGNEVEITPEIVTQAINAATQETQITAVKEETEKWQFIEKYFASDLNTSKLQQKVGFSLNNYSSYIAFPTTFTLSCFMALYARGSGYDNIFEKLDNKFLDAIKYITKLITDAPTTSDWEAERNARCYTVGGMGKVLRPIIIFLVINKILKAISKKLENEDERSLQLLTDFLNNWEKNKAQTPTSLIPMFDALTTENNISRKPFQKTVDKALAKKIVAAISATSLIMRSSLS